MRRSILQRILSSIVVCTLASACESEEDTEHKPDASPEAGASQNDASSGATDSGGAMVADAGNPGASDASSLRDTSSPGDASSSDSGGGASDASMNSADAGALPKFSFFVTSLNAMRTLSKSQNGFGGDLRFGEMGDGAGLRGADKICAAAAEIGMKGASAKVWRAFLSTSTVAAKSRIGDGPWYDRNGRLVAQTLTALLKERPEGAPTEIRDDLPNETGAPNREGSAEGSANDNHDVVTGTNLSGTYDGASCSDWTSTSATGGSGSMNGPRVGHSWPAMSGRSWMTAHRAPGCAPSVALVQNGAGSGTGIGNGGGYGGIYCFATTP